MKPEIFNFLETLNNCNLVNNSASALIYKTTDNYNRLVIPTELRPYDDQVAPNWIAL